MTIQLESIILTIRGHRVILASDLAELYGVTVKRLNEQVKRNIERFPSDFMFQLEIQEVTNLKSQIATSSWGGRRKLPYVFTEHGAVMAANVLNSPVAIDASNMLVRTFVKMRMIFSEHSDLKKRLQEIEKRLALGFAEHEQELQEIRFLISQLENPVETNRRKIGFFRDEKKA
jgi:hypothetical protein